MTSSAAPAPAPKVNEDLTLDELIQKQAPGYSLTEVATAARITRRALFLLRAGRVATPQPKTLLGLATALRTSREQVYASVIRTWTLAN